MDHHEDNISDEILPPAIVPPDDSTTDEYMNKFERLESQIQKGRQAINLLAHQPDQDHRLFALMRWAEQQQKVQEDMYGLLVEMNNFFAPK